MKRIVPFNKFRYVAYALSLVVIVGGIGGTLLFRGYNWGTDFRGGLSQEIQIAPVAFQVASVAGKVIDFNLTEQEVRYIIANEKQEVLPRVKDQPLAELVKQIEAIGDLKITILDQSAFPTALLIPIHKEISAEKPLTINHRLPQGTAPQATISAVRETLLPVVPQVTIQAAGAPGEQSFLVRSDPSLFKATAEMTADDVAAKTVITALEAKYGTGTVIQKQKESLGPQQAQSLAIGSVVAVFVALLAMLLYVSIRFRLNYAAAAVIALFHDALTTIAFVGVFQVEVNTAVVAAILTIIGYSINDTVVIYDRIRENEKLQKGRPLGFIMDLSVTQTLGRTFITSLTVFVAIVPLYILGVGPVKDFSFAMIFGLITGSYSTIFIASPIALSWQNAVEKAKRNKEIKRFGHVQTPELEVRPEEPAPEIAPATELQEGAPEAAVPATPSFDPRGTGPITRVQRVLEKKKKKRNT
jgi:preprotein translocase subunit SecF